MYANPPTLTDRQEEHMETIEFFVAGTPRPGGSKKSFRHAKTQKIITKEAGKYTPIWRDFVKRAATIAMEGREHLVGPVKVIVIFHMRRPKSHFNSKGELKPTAPKYHTSMPDATKLWRSTEDALKLRADGTLLCWKDDSQVADQRAIKIYSDREGADVRIMAMEDWA